jgi:copper homeostasis protein (lipoprotein)
LIFSIIYVILTYMRKPLLIIILLSISLGACSSTNPAKTVDNSRTSLDWAGVYAGTIPAADGPGINVQITLRPDESYSLVYNYVDKPNNAAETGTFSWNEAGNTITLKNTTFPPYYRVGENHLLQLDMKGNVIKGKLADLYILKKMN